MGYVSRYKGIDIDQAIEFAKNNANINDKLSGKAEALHTHKLSDITGLSDLKISWENITGKPEKFPCDGSCGSSSGSEGDGGGSVSGTVAWANITGKPTTFAPTAHTHVITDLSNLADLTIDWNNIVNKPENIGNGSEITSISWDNIINKPHTFTPSSHNHTWDSIESKPTQFIPTAHRHSASDIDGYVPGSGGSISWDDVLEKPDLASKVHKHSVSDVIGLEDRLTNIELNGGGGSGNSPALSNRLDIVENDLENLQSQVEIVQTGFSIVQSTVVANQGTINSIQTTTTNLKDDIVGVKNSIEELKTSVGQGNNLGTEVSSLKQNVLALAQKDVELENDIIGVENNLGELNTKITQTSDIVDGINNSVTNAYKEIEELRETVEQFTGTFEDQLEGALAGSEFGTRLDNLESEVSDNTTTVNELSSTVSEIQENVSEIENTVDSIQDTLSDHYYIWQGEDDTIPELTNEPAVQWITVNDKRQHLGDFYINSLGYCYKFIEESVNVFAWEEVKDRYIVPYAKQIEKKSSIFINQPLAIDAYKPGDLWINATYINNDETIFSSETLVCVEEKAEGDEFNINHWESCEFAKIQDINNLDLKINKNQKRAILQNSNQLYEENTWLDETGNLWIYEGLIVSVIDDQKLFLLINKDEYQYPKSWVEIGKTLSLTWDNITDKPEFLETLENDVEAIKSDISNLSSIVEDNQLSIIDRIESIENENLSEINDTISELNNLLSDHYYIWQGEDDAIPSLLTEPAVQWITVSDKRQHLGDFYINSLGYCYKFIEESVNVFAWEEVKDRYIVPYAKQIEKKSSIFINQPLAIDAYKPGDLWINATYTRDGETSPMYSEEMLVCIEEKIEGDEFNINHWELANIAGIKEINNLTNTIENYRTRVILERQDELYLEDTWRDSSGNLWIYEGLVISVLNVGKLYLLIDKENYQEENSWVEIGKTLSLTWDNIENKPEFLEGIEGRVDEIESFMSTLDTNLNDNVNDLSNRIDSIENESIVGLENTIDSIQDLLSDHYYIWQGEDDTIPELTNEPAVQWISETDKRQHLGDFYINSLGYCYKFSFEENKYFWKEVEDRYIVPYAKRIAGKSTIFISQPSVEDCYTPGDIWLNATYYSEENELIYDRVTLVCIQEKIEDQPFNINDWEIANIVDKELQEIDKKVENYRTRIILKRQEDLYLEDTWKDSDGNSWIYEGLVVSALDVGKLYLLIDEENYQYPESWVEIGKTLSLTWDNITDKPDLSLSDHIHDNYETSISNLDDNVLTLQEDMQSVQEMLEEYNSSTFPKIEENLSEINDSLIGQFYIWHGIDNEVPTKFTYPEVNWISTGEKNKHLGDFYITLDGVCYKYTLTDLGFEWVLVSDRYITSYAKKIDKKSTIFNAIPTTDDEYKPGDLWINATYDDPFGTRIFNNDIVVCTVGKESGDIFNWSDWQAVLKADDINIDNTALTVGANQTILGHKTFAVPIYFGKDGTGPTSEGDAYRPLYSTIYEDGNNFFIEAGKRATTNEIITFNLKNTTAGPIRITSELTKEFRSESSTSGSIEIESKNGGDISVISKTDNDRRAGKIKIATAGAKKENELSNNLGIFIDSETNTASIYSQDTQVTNLCDGYMEVSGYNGFAITSKATTDKNDMTGVRFKWEKEDQDGNTLNTLDIHRVSYIDGKVVPESLNIKVNGGAEVLTSANFRTYVESDGNIIDFNTGYITKPGQTEGNEDVSELLQSAINDAISNNAKLIIKYGTYLLKKKINIRGLNRDFASLTIDANNALFLTDIDLVQNMPNYGGTLPDGGTQRDDLTLDDIKSTGALFTIGTNPTKNDEDDYDQGTLEFLNARIKVLNSNAKRSTLVAFDIQSQKCVRFEKVIIEDFHTGFKMERSSKNPSIRKSRIINTVFGIHSLGKVYNLTVEDVDFIRNGTAVYVDRESIGDFSCNIFSHCLFDNCNQGIYGHSKYVISALRVKSCKFNSNESFDIFLKNRIIYPTIENVTFTDTTKIIPVPNGDGTFTNEEVVVPWQERSSIEISIPPGYIIDRDTALNRELSNVIPAESTIGGTHTATWTKTPLNWGDNNIIITDNIFYDCHLVQIGNDKNGSHISGVEFSGNRIEGSIENCIKICSEVDGNCSGISVFSNSYGSTKKDMDGSTIDINFEVPIKSDLLKGNDYMPAGGFIARYSKKPVVPKTNKTEEGQVGDIRWDETKAYLKTETGWKAIQFTHAFDNEGIANEWKPLETRSQEPVFDDIVGYKVGDFLWNLDGNSTSLGWRLIKREQTGAASWEKIEELIRSKLNG